MSTTNYIINSNGFIVREAFLGESASEGFSTLELDQSLGDLQLNTGSTSIQRYKVEGGKAIEQKVAPFAEINSNNDVIAVHLLGSLTPANANLIPITEKQYLELTQEHEDYRESGLVDFDYALPRYQMSKKKVSKKRNLFDKVSHCDQALARINRTMDQIISARYSAGKEAKLSKDFLGWIADGQPKKDSRQEAFQAMQDFIGEVRGEFAAIKKKIKAQREKLQKD